jgi:hypothetical protein
LCANGGERRHFAQSLQSLHKAYIALHKCTESVLMSLRIVSFR